MKQSLSTSTELEAAFRYDDARYVPDELRNTLRALSRQHQLDQQRRSSERFEAYPVARRVFILDANVGVAGWREYEARRNLVWLAAIASAEAGLASKQQIDARLARAEHEVQSSAAQRLAADEAYARFCSALNSDRASQ